MPDRKQSLIDLGASALAQVLLDLAAQSNRINELVDRLITPPADMPKEFRRALVALKKSEHFYNYREVGRFARKLSTLLMGLKTGIEDPFTGMTLLAAFYETDAAIFATADDSNGCIGQVYEEAKSMFLEYAARFPDKTKIADIVQKLNRRDDYGVRSDLIDCASQYLPESVLRSMITNLQDWVPNEKDPYTKRRHQHSILSLAKQIKDPELYEKTCLEAWEKHDGTFIDIAQVYLDCDKVDSALACLMKMDESNTFKRDEREAMLIKIYRQQGNVALLGRLLLQRFRAHRNLEKFKDLLDVIGHERRDEVIQEELRQLMEAAEFSDSGTKFLVTVGKVDEAEALLLKHVVLDRDSYACPLDLAEAMELAGRNFTASMIYRKFVTAVLMRGDAKAYDRCVAILQKLDQLAERAFDWRGYRPHQSFKDQLYALYKRKHSFWTQYENAKKPKDELSSRKKR